MLDCPAHSVDSEELPLLWGATALDKLHEHQDWEGCDQQLGLELQLTFIGHQIAPSASDRPVA